MKLKKIAALLAIAGLSAPAFATNGMNMEGYGPVATAMGGASMAYDNGTAGLINNPATLSLMQSGTSRLDVAMGGLHPSISLSAGAFGSAASDGKSYYMPAIGYVRKDGGLTWGIGMMSQGGMGTEFGTGSFMSAGTGQEVRSELGLGRIMLPLAFDVSDSLRIAGTFDYVWGGLDMAAAISTAQFGAMAANFGNTNRNAAGYVLANTMGFAFAGGDTAAYINASQGKDHFKQKMTTTGFAGNLGFVWSATPQLTLGGVYHARTNLSDMDGGAVMSTYAGAVQTAAMGGTLTVRNFQWPETYGLGLAYKPSDALLIALDYKNIAWSQVMKTFTVSFRNAGGNVDFGFNQNWKDQDVFQLGVAYKMDNTTTLRAGLSLADSPIASSAANGVMHPLFPATPSNHFTVGAGFALDKASSIDLSLSHAPSVHTVNNSGIGASHSQTNWQAMFSYRY